jgi:SPP1 family predicted phage head-tail adaptor
MRVGDLNKRVRLQRKSTVDNAAGQSVVTWVDICPIWAAIEPLNAIQRVSAQQIHPDVSHSITVRYRPDFASALLITALRIVYKGRVFSLAGGLNLNERNIQVDLMAIEGMNDG